MTTASLTVPVLRASRRRGQNDMIWNRRKDRSGSYVAFISYSHADGGEARRLHRWLERYTIPASCRTNSRWLRPVFRDEEEFAASPDLGAQIRSALDRSRALIVICSDTAASSRWVDEEIRHFVASHPTLPLLAALTVDGEQSFPSSMPPALRRAHEGGP